MTRWRIVVSFGSSSLVARNVGLRRGWRRTATPVTSGDSTVAQHDRQRPPERRSRWPCHGRHRSEPPAVAIMSGRVAVAEFGDGGTVAWPVTRLFYRNSPQPGVLFCKNEGSARRLQRFGVAGQNCLAACFGGDGHVITLRGQQCTGRQPDQIHRYPPTSSRFPKGSRVPCRISVGAVIGLWLQPVRCSVYSNLKCLTDSPESRSSANELMPISRCSFAYFSVTALSLLVVLTPSGAVGLSETSSNAPFGM